MKFFAVKSSKIEFFTEVKGLADQAPPVPAGKLLPEWYKKIPEFEGPRVDGSGAKMRGVNTDVKRCPGIRDFIGSGFIIPLWCDYNIDVEPDGSLNWLAPDGAFKLGSHPVEQLQGMPQEHPYPAIKFINPWFVRTPPGYSCLFLPPFYEFEKRFTVLPGVVDTDFYHNAHLPTLLHINPGKSMLLERGTPIVHVFPFKREEMDSDCREASEEDERAIAKFQLGVRSTFDSNYRKTQKERSDANE